MKWSATACSRFSTFFEKALVSRVKRRMLIRIVRFERSTWLVLAGPLFGASWITVSVMPVQMAVE